MNPINLTACLALYQHRRDCAIGLSHVTTKTRGLLWYYNFRNQELYRRLFVQGFNLGVIRQARKRIKEIKKQVTIDTPLDKAQRLHQEALMLQDQITKSYEAMNG